MAPFYSIHSLPQYRLLLPASPKILSRSWVTFSLLDLIDQSTLSRYPSPLLLSCPTRQAYHQTTKLYLAANYFLMPPLVPL
jgi:hypothetical protein